MGVVPRLAPLGEGKVDDCLHPGRWLLLKSLLDGVATFVIQPHLMPFNVTLLWGIWPFVGTEHLEDHGGGVWTISGLGGNIGYRVRAAHAFGFCSDVFFRTP